MSEIDVNSGNHASKAKRTREKIALVIFLAIVAFGAYVIYWYFSTATAYNVAATKVDETAGTMESYVTLIYSGTYESTVPEEGEARLEGPSTSADSTDEDDESTVPEPVDESVTEPVVSADLSTEHEPVYVSDIRDKYFDKSASVATINLSLIQQDKDINIVMVGGKKIGIFSIQSYANRNLIESKIQELYDQQVNVVLCVVPRTTLLATFDHIDGIICTAEKSPSEPAEGYNNSTFICRAPEIGSVGVLTISSSNVMTSNVYASLDE